MLWEVNFHFAILTRSLTLGQIKPKLILTGGSPIKLEEEYKLDFYFDQRGVLIKQLGIKAVPAIVMQDGKVLKIREVMVR